MPDLANRRLLGRKKAAVFILLNVYRRFMLAFLILGFYLWPIIQVISTLFMQLAYMVFITNFTIYDSPSKQCIELINEWVVLVTIYILSLLAGDYITDPDLREDIGIALISLTGINFFVNFVPHGVHLVRYLKLVYKRRLERQDYERIFEARKRRIAQVEAAKEEVAKENAEQKKAELAKMLQEEKAINDLLVTGQDKMKKKRLGKRRQEQSTVIEDSRLNISQS